MDFPRWASRSGRAISPLEGSRIAVPGMQGFVPCSQQRPSLPQPPAAPPRPRPRTRAAARPGLPVLT